MKKKSDSKPPKGGLPERYASAGDFCAQTLFPKSMVKYGLDHGGKFRDGSARILLHPFLEFFAPILAKVFAGDGKRLAGMDKVQVLDLQEQRARLAAAQAEEQEVKNSLEAGILCTKEGVMAAIWDGGLRDVADAWRNYERSTGVTLRKAAIAAGLSDADAKKLVAIAVQGVTEPVKILREKLNNEE